MNQNIISDSSGEVFSEKLRRLTETFQNEKDFNGTLSGLIDDFIDNINVEVEPKNPRMNEQSGTKESKNECSFQQILAETFQRVYKILQSSLTVTSTIVATGMALAINVIPSTQAQRASNNQIVWLILLGLIFYTFVFHLIILFHFKTAAGKRYCEKFQLKRFEIYDVCVKIVSALQAFLACVFACLVLLENRCHRHDKYSAYSRWIDIYTWFGLPYFFYDIVVMYKGYIMEHGYMDALTFILRNKIMIIHHIYIPTIGLLGVMEVRRKFGDCVFMFFYCMEFSTIFVNIRLILHRLKMTSSVWYFINGIAMLLSFFFCRIYMVPAMLYSYSKLFELSLVEAFLSLPPISQACIVLYMILQVYWMGLMLRVAYRTAKLQLTRL